LWRSDRVPHHCSNRFRPPPMGVNSITLVGRAGRDPEVRYFESGSMVANLTLAVNRRS